MESPETSCREALKQYLEEFTAELKKEEEEAEGGGEELPICDPGDSGSTTSDMLSQSSSCSVPTFDLNTSVDFWVFFTIRSVVSRVNLGCKLDLKHICKNTWNTEYRSQVLIMRIRKPRTTARVFRSGKLVCLGAQSIEDSHLAARRFARIVQKQGFNVRFQNFRICNIMATSSFFPVSLEKLYNAYREHSSYNQEISSFLTFKLDMGITANIFANGNTTLFGAKSPTELHEAVKTLFYILRSFTTF